MRTSYKVRMGKSSKAKRERRLHETPSAFSASGDESHTPWHESNVLWFGISTFAAILLTVVPALKSDLRWLLWVAWLIALVPLGMMSRNIPRIRKGTRVLAFGCSLFLLSWGLYVLNGLLDPVGASNGSGSLFSVEVRSAVVSESGPITLYMVTHPSMFGNTASPVFYMAYVQITNLQNIPTTIREIKFAVSEQPDGPWESLVPIPLAHTNLYALGASTPYRKTLAFSSGTYRLATLVKKDMEKAARLFAKPALQSELSNAIEPHRTVTGWVALDPPSHRSMPPGRFYLRVALGDTAHRNGTYVVELASGKAEEVSVDVDNGSIEVLGILEDISSYYLRYYSDPYPNPTTK